MSETARLRVRPEHLTREDLALMRAGASTSHVRCRSRDHGAEATSRLLDPAPGGYREIEGRIRDLCLQGLSPFAVAALDLAGGRGAEVLEVAPDAPALDALPLPGSGSIGASEVARLDQDRLRQDGVGIKVDADGRATFCAGESHAGGLAEALYKAAVWIGGHHLAALAILHKSRPDLYAEAKRGYESRLARQTGEKGYAWAS